MNSKSKLILLITGVVLLLILSYSFAFSKTIDLKKEYKALNQKAELIENRPKQLAILSLREIYYDSILTSKNLGNTSLENSLLKVINKEANLNNLKVIDFNDSHNYENQSKILNTFDFSLQGQFTDLLKVIYVLEAENSFGEIVHLAFEKKRNYRKRKDFLTARIFLQQIE